MRTGLLVLGLILLLAGILLLAKQQQRALAAGLPVRIACVDENEARALAGPGAVAVLGTGSMAPYIPAALPGRDPMVTTTAYVVLDPAASYESIAVGALVLYAPDWSKHLVLHQAASKDWLGWIMGGLHNKDFEPSWRVTAANYKGTVIRTYVWPPR